MVRHQTGSTIMVLDSRRDSYASTPIEPWIALRRANDLIVIVRVGEASESYWVADRRHLAHSTYGSNQLHIHKSLIFGQEIFWGVDRQ
jgi:hypothetical protein